MSERTGHLAMWKKTNSMADWGYEETGYEAGSSRVVLLVEDEMIIAFDIADHLTAAGFEVD